MNLETVVPITKMIGFLTKRIKFLNNIVRHLSLSKPSKCNEQFPFILANKLQQKLNVKLK